MIRPLALTLLALALASPALAETNVAVVDFEAVIARSTKARAALGEVGVLRKAKGDELLEMANAFRAKQADVQAKAASMTESERRRASTDLQRMETDIKRATEDAELEVQQRANQVLNDLNKELGPLVRQLALDRGIHLVLQYGTDLGLVFVDDSLDITDDVIAAYDAADSGE